MTEQLHDKTPWIMTLYSDELKGRLSSMEVIPLFACESGSRAWGFASQNSDYDVRFVYRRPKEWYLNLDEFNRQADDDADTIQIPLIRDHGLKVDAVGWDIRKFLSLVGKGNATPIEWGLACPRYWQDPEWEIVASIIRYYADPDKLLAHYRGMSTKHWRRYMEGKDTVTHKKYLYILRGIWSTEWYLNYSGVASIRFEDLMSASNASVIVKEEVWDLLNRKRNGDELGLSKPNVILDQYIADIVSLFGLSVPDFASHPGWDKLNKLFHYTLTMDGGNYERRT